MSCFILRDLWRVMNLNLVLASELQGVGKDTYFGLDWDIAD